MQTCTAAELAIEPFQSAYESAIRSEPAALCLLGLLAPAHHGLQPYGCLQVNAEGLCQQRSLKYFQALAQGCWLVGWAWLEACAAAGRWLPEEPYEVAGDHVGLGAPKAGTTPPQNHQQSYQVPIGVPLGSGLMSCSDVRAVHATCDLPFMCSTPALVILTWKMQAGPL